jgi:hypothetical protein
MTVSAKPPPTYLNVVFKCSLAIGDFEIKSEAVSVLVFAVGRVLKILSMPMYETVRIAAAALIFKIFWVLFAC